MQVTWQLSLITLLKTKIDQRSNIFKNKKIEKILKDSEKKYKLDRLRITTMRKEPEIEKS